MCKDYQLYYQSLTRNVKHCGKTVYCLQGEMTVILLAAIQGYKLLTAKLRGQNRYLERKGKINFTPW